MGKKFLFVFFSCFLAATNLIYSQVGINTESPNLLTELEITNLKNSSDKIIPKGVMIPRMTEDERKEIVVSDLANSLMIYNTTEDCYNYYSKTDSEWKSLCGAMGKAVIDPIDCNNIVPFGTYIEGVTLDGSNYLEVTMNVTKAGSYTIAFTTSNGYGFYDTGVALDPGPLKIRVLGQGKPVAVQTDVLIPDGVTLLNDCEAKVQVVSAVAEYSLTCLSGVANGQYVKGRALVGSNTITISVNVTKVGSYNVTTPVTYGISFSDSGTFTTTGWKTITLTGHGKPTVNLDFPIKVMSNTSEGNAECSVNIPMTLPEMTYAIVGNDGTYSWSTSERRSALTNGSSFGPNGIVKMVKFSELWNTGTQATAATRLNNGYNGKYPDIVLYFAHNTPPTTELTTALKDYINKGGCVIYGSADNTRSAVQTLMDGLFGGITVQAQISSSPNEDDIYPINNLPNDPVVNGPFGNLSELFWGEDNTTTGSVIMTSLPPNSVQICSANSQLKSASQLLEPERSIVWYNDSKNFLYFGDSTGSSTSDLTNNAYPALYTTSGVPRTKVYGPNSTYRRYVYNAALELNAVAWAIKKAAVGGINPL